MIYKNFFKRIFDIAFSAFLIFLLILPSLFIALIIKIVSRGPVIHWSDRVGQNSKIFKMPKFRSMNINTPQNIPTNLFKNPKFHIYPFGNFLRKTSLDEIPQLLSILKGEMSFVGPRPSLTVQTDLNNLRINRSVCDLVPGITGWAQINGRDNISIEEKVKLEVEYKKLQSFSFDLLIIFVTIKSIFFRQNISH